MVRRTWIKTQNNPKQTITKLNSIFNDLFSLFLCPPNCLYIDDVLSINNPEFENYLGQMYPVELEIKDTTESNTSASYLDLLLSIERDGRLHTFI